MVFQTQGETVLTGAISEEPVLVKYQLLKTCPIQESMPTTGSRLPESRMDVRKPSLMEDSALDTTQSVAPRTVLEQRLQNPLHLKQGTGFSTKYWSLLAMLISDQMHLAVLPQQLSRLYRPQAQLRPQQYHRRWTLLHQLKQQPLHHLL